jgi:ABC-type multidrug transport system ATPase subunit
VRPPALQLRGVHRAYGRLKAVDGLSFTVPAGSVCALIGPNGAGKTTTFSLVGGLMPPDAGEIDLLGEGPFDVLRHRGRVSLLPQDAELSSFTPVRGLLRHFAQLQGMSAGGAAKEADRLLAEVGLEDKAGARVHQLSHGMRRRVALAQALLGDPELILLDEPTSGLDPDLVVRVRALIRARGGRTAVLVSSHQLLELESTCDHAVFIEAGRCTHEGPMREVLGVDEQIQYALTAPLGALAVGQGVTLEPTAGGARARVPPGASVAEVNAVVLPALLAAGIGVISVSPGVGSLEDAWLARRKAPPA